MPGPPSEIRVLCIDDDSSVRDLLTHMLESVDSRLTAEDSGDPTKVVQQIRDGDYDCLVCDYEMSEMDGLDVLEAVRAEFPGLPFILYTGKGSEEIASEAISAGVTDYLQKDAGQDHYELLANRIVEYATHYRTNKAYELTEERYRHLVEQSVVGIALSQDRTFQYANPRFAELFGYSPEELVGMDALAVIDESDHDRVKEALAIRESGTVDSVHYVVTAKDRHGVRFDLEVNGGRVSYQGEPAVLGVVQPLDTRRKALAELDGDAIADLTTSLELAHDALTGDSTETDTAVATRAIESALATVEPEPGSHATAAGRTDLADSLRAAWEAVEPSQATLSINGSRQVTGPGTTVEQFFTEVLSAWDRVGDPLTLTLDTSEDGFDITVHVACDDPSDLDVPQPAVLSRLAELLEWDIYITEPDDCTAVYSFRGLGTAETEHPG